MSSASANPPVKKGYHHGSLHSALIDASIALAREGGPDRVVLREAARLAGVSHSAAYRHFADREALLTEVSRHARAELAAEMRRRVSRTTDPQKRLQAVGVAYIDFALNQPGLFRAAFTSHPATAIGDRSDAADAESSDAAEPYQVLGQVLDETQAAGLLNPRRRPGAEIAVWSAVHGLACLLLDGPLPATPAAVKFATGQVFDLIENGLLGSA
ncbi:TetR/AcrR family transcriptional regulator [Mycolicibacterium moriokaense]|uniref:TetR family transcriptional regulator n=1 Tax=Mycolicibacterium moriokaense TaxID=39691 RepID=A0A318HHZ0_9MYCO|nr:TetR/AcrR family transcriptional regulator [Mycolicibacterium moriokaense]PXW99932.1 TetR family transcriptional regulator [Mycolicibacterium moriokaense]